MRTDPRMSSPAPPAPPGPTAAVPRESPAMPASARHPSDLALARSRPRAPGVGHVFRLILGAAASVAGLSSARAGEPKAPKVDYNFAVRPVLADRCFVCHGPDERARKADLRLDLPDGAADSGAVVPG